MKYLSEYRDPGIVEKYLKRIHDKVSRPWHIMEVCGGQTHGLVKNGITALLPDEVEMIHGPGCPVCVTPLRMIDQAIALAEEHDVILCSFGDMLRVPGSKKSLLEVKAAGADVRVLYSPLQAVEIARSHPDREVVFFAVGFETTAPANALSVIHAKEKGLTNYSILVSHVLVPPAIEAIMQDPQSHIDGFLAAGHVCTIMGTGEYQPLTEKYQVPIVVTGFEPVDLLQGIDMVIAQLENGEAKLENQYSRVVFPEGNVSARAAIERVFDVGDREWRGIGTIPGSGYILRETFRAFDASKKFQIAIGAVQESPECIAGQVLKGIKKPFECPQFGKACKPENPLGAPMVSSEGACAAYYQHAHVSADPE